MDAIAACYMGELGPKYFFADIQKVDTVPWEEAVWSIKKGNSTTHGGIRIVLESFLEFIGERIIVYYSSNSCDYDWINFANCFRKSENKYVELPTRECWFDFYNMISRKLVEKKKPINASDCKLGRLYWNLLCTNQDKRIQENFDFPEYFLQIDEVDMPGPLRDSIFLWNIVMCFANSLTFNFNRDDENDDTTSVYAV